MSVTRSTPIFFDRTTQVANTSQIIASVTVSAGQRMLVLMSGARFTIDNQADLKFNGISLGAPTKQTTSGPAPRVHGWEYFCPTAGTFNLVVTNTTNENNGLWYVELFSGDSTAASTNAADENSSGSSCSPALSPAPAADTLVIMFAGGYPSAASGLGTGVSPIRTDSATNLVERTGGQASLTYAGGSQIAGIAFGIPAAAIPPVITGPTGSAGASSITTSSAENQNVAGVWTVTNGGTWSLTGTDASMLSISGGTVTKASGNFDYDSATGGKNSYSFNVVNTSGSGTATQAVTLNVTDINEAPSFIGPAIGALVLTQGTAMTPVNIAAKFADPEGLTVTGTVVESLPAGLSVSGGVLQGTPTTVQAAANYTPRGADPANNATNGTVFTIQVVSPTPNLTAPTANATGTTTATATFTTDALGGNAFFLRRTGTTPASQATVASTGESQAVTSVGVQSRNMTAFASGTPYYVDMTQTGAPGVVSAGPFTPSTMATSGSPAAQGGVAGAAFTYTGSTPASFITGGIGTKTFTLVAAGGSGLSSINGSTGVPAGTLTSTPGTYTPVIRCTDSSTAGINPTGGGAPPQTIDFTLTLIVSASGSATSVVISNASPATGQVGQLSNNFTVGANGTITGTVAVTPSDNGGGGSFVPTVVNISSGSPTATFKYLPGATGAKSITTSNNGALSDPAAVTYTVTAAAATTLTVTLTTDGITPIPNLTGLKVAVYDQATPDLWAGHQPIYATAAGSTDAFGVLTCNIAGLTTLVPGQLAGLSISNSDGTLTQGAAQRGYVGPAAVS